MPVTAAVRAAGELLGIDPLHVANEGKAVLGVRPGGRRRACSRRCAPIRWAATPHRRHLHRRARRARSSSTPGSAAGSWPSPRASRCHAYADARPPCASPCSARGGAPGLGEPRSPATARRDFDIVCCLVDRGGLRRRGRDSRPPASRCWRIRSARFYAASARRSRRPPVRRDYDRRTVELLAPYRPDLVLLSSYLYVLTAPRARRPSRTGSSTSTAAISRASGRDGRPLYPGLRAVRDAILAGEPRDAGDGAPRHRAARRRADPAALVAVPGLAARRASCGAAGARHAVNAYAFAHQEWMLATAWGPLLTGVDRPACGRPDAAARERARRPSSRRSRGRRPS